LNLARAFKDHDFAGYPLANRVARFIDKQDALHN
jgi:hypothetical protein